MAIWIRRGIAAAMPYHATLNEPIPATHRLLLRNRPGWAEISAVRDNWVYEIPSADILQPGFRLIQGFEQLKRQIRDSRQATSIA